MFRRFRREEDNVNRLIDEREPNKLSWTSDDADAEDEEDLEESAEEDEAEEPEEDEEAAARKKADLDAELAREAEEYGLTGSNPERLYGPNGEDVAAVIDALSEIDDETANDIADAYEAVPAAERKVAQAEVRRMQRSSDYESELWAAERAVADWLAALDLDDDSQALYAIVADAATDAVDALILEDELVDLDFNALYGPWSDVMDTDEEEGEEGETEGESAADGQAGAAASEAEAEDEGEFGPNTELVEQFFRKLEHVTPAEISELVETWRGQPKEELRVAHRNLQELADEEPKWRKQLHAAQDEVFAWIEGQSDRIHSANLPLGNLREVSGPVIADGVAALVMADMLEAEDAAVLYAPWASVIKEPALPEYDEDDEDDSEGE